MDMREIWKTIKKNVQLSLSDMDKSCSRTNRELVYGAVACTAVGMILGMMFSPKKSTTIGSHNGNYTGPASQSPANDNSENTADEE